MSFSVVMPKAGLTMTEGTISQWMKASGEYVRKGEILLIIENEKSTIEVESPHEGILLIKSEVEREVPVGETIAELAESQEEYEKLMRAKDDIPFTVSASAAGMPGIASAPVSNNCAAGSSAKGRVIATPLAKKVARNNQVDLACIHGTGPNGRIVERDVLDYIQCSTSALQTTQNTVEDFVEPPTANNRTPTHVPLSKTRKVIARRMMESLQTMAQVSASVELDVSNLVLLRDKLATQVEDFGVKISMTDLFARILITAVKKHPYVNAEMADEEMILYPYVNLSIAVATDAGLQVPVVKNSDQMPLLTLSKAIKEVSKKARDGKLSPDDMSGGTITLSNVSMFPVDTSTPIINVPQTTILGLGRIVKKAVIVNDEIVIRPMMNIFMTYDHRAYDGSEACYFLQTVKELVENPERFLI